MNQKKLSYSLKNMYRNLQLKSYHKLIVLKRKIIKNKKQSKNNKNMKKLLRVYKQKYNN